MVGPYVTKAVAKVKRKSRRQKRADRIVATLLHNHGKADGLADTENEQEG